MKKWVWIIIILLIIILIVAAVFLISSNGGNPGGLEGSQAGIPSPPAIPE